MEINLPKCLNLDKRKIKTQIQGKHLKASLMIKVRKNKIIIKAKLK